MHTLFSCPIARATSFDFVTALLVITGNLSDEQVVLFCNIIWNLWKARNEAIFSEKATTPATVLARAKMLHVSNQQLTVQTHGWG